MLPVENVLPELHDALSRRGRAVLIAPPGAGKTTRVPPALLVAPWLGDRRLVMLEPRRLAARAAARRIAAERGETVGETVGVRVRGETRVGLRTRIEVVTEGVLTRMLQDDPSLDGVGAVVFDEFHERSLAADTGLALVLGATAVLRDDLRVVVMSATLEGAAVARLLGDAPVIRSDATSHPVATRWSPPTRGRELERHVGAVVIDTLRQEQGSQLVFLPGAREIRRVEAMLAGRVPSDVDVRPLFGAMPSDAQDAAIAPSPPGRRKVVLATNVAETSLTIADVRVVIDSGLERVPRFSPRTGMTRLETMRITRASADQRRGRAGRTAPGVAIRCWSADEDAGLLVAPRAEIVDADLAPLALDLAAAGFADPGELPWLDPPPVAAFQVARQLLSSLGALDADGRLTGHGRAMARFGAHPRIAHLLLRATERSPAAARRAAVLAALLEERDVLRGDGQAPPVDLRLRVDAVERHLDHAMLAGASLDRGAVARARESAREWQRRVGVGEGGADDADSVGALLALAWPERIARRREATGRFLTAGGRGVRLFDDDALAQAEWLVVAELDDRGTEARALLAAPLEAADVEEMLAAATTVEEVIEWDRTSEGVVASRRERLGAIIVRQRPVRNADPGLIRCALLAGLRELGVDRLPWSDDTRRLRARLAFVHHHDSAWPDVSDDVLQAELEEWLGPFLDGKRRADQVTPAEVGEALLSRLDWQQRRRLDEVAPERIEVPSGSRIAIDYDDPAAPVLAVRLQEVFGLAATPLLMNGRVALVMHLLSPAQRPMQVTTDLASFWRTGYFEVRKDLRGRYPRHHWPEDPTSAGPQRGARRRK